MNSPTTKLLPQAVIVGSSLCHMSKAGIHSRVELAVKASRANIVVSDEDRLNGMGN